MTDKEILIIESDIFLHKEDMKRVYYEIMKMKEEGVILLQPYLHPLVVPEDIEIKFRGCRNDKRSSN